MTIQRIDGIILHSSATDTGPRGKYLQDADH